MPRKAITVATGKITLPFDLLAERFFDKSLVVFGGYEFQFYVLDKFAHIPLVDVTATFAYESSEAIYHLPTGESVDTKRFIEEFVGSVMTNFVILREEGCSSSDITIHVGSDGSMQQGIREDKKQLCVCPASISKKPVQAEIIRCIKLAIDLYEERKIDQIALAQAKAKNRYIVKRAFARRILHG